MWLLVQKGGIVYSVLSCINQVAIANIISSSGSRISPGVGIGAFPERLLSFGTAKHTPQIKANIIGKPIAKKNLRGLSV
uniref:hypothetical protein n=1 Tax=Polaribacter sp. TaxID=1920175 RepID=UPI004047D297